MVRRNAWMSKEGLKLYAPQIKANVKAEAKESKAN